MPSSAPIRSGPRTGQVTSRWTAWRCGAVKTRRVLLDEVRERPVVGRVAGLECLDRLVDSARAAPRTPAPTITSSRLSHGSS